VRRGPLLALAVAIVVAVVDDQRIVARATVAVVAVAALVLLFRLAGRGGGEPELPETWRPYG